MGALAFPAETDLAGEIYALVENIKLQQANESFSITVDEGTASTTLAAATATVVTQTAVDVVTTAPALTSYGFTQAQAAAILTAINALVADGLEAKNTINALVADVEALRQLNATLVDALAAVGAVSIA